ncbi:hypothetical protein MMC22_001023 [Lobaria immixta]|nr:hypothetical protein [Lobaria immixta]
MSTWKPAKISGSMTKRGSSTLLALAFCLAVNGVRGKSTHEAEQGKSDGNYRAAALAPGNDGLFGLRQMKMVSYDGATGDGTLDHLGFDVETMSGSRLRFLTINYRPPVEQVQKYLDAVELGANATVESGWGLAYPNGIVKGKDGLYYVPNVFVNKISVFKLQPDLMLKEGNIIRAGMPVDNRSVDRNEKIWTAAIPKPLDIGSAPADPYKFAF